MNHYKILILNTFDLVNINSFNILGIYQDCLNYNLPFDIITIIKLNSNERLQKLIYSINKLISPNINLFFYIDSNYIIPSKILENNYGKNIVWSKVTDNLNKISKISNNKLLDIIKKYDKIVINTFGNLDYLGNLKGKTYLFTIFFLLKKMKILF